MQTSLASGVNHRIPADMRRVLTEAAGAREIWNSLTPLARNEWICWVTMVKKADTRTEHLKRLTADLAKGKRRPCCWPGCPHRQKNWYDRQS